MDKTLEMPFLKAFDFGGVVHNCIDYIRHKYDLGYLPRLDSYKEDEKSQNFYEEVYPKVINEKTEAFDESVIIYHESPLIDEIESNLRECLSKEEKERYIFSLLKPFSEIAKVYCPVAEINRIKEEITKLEKDRKLWAAIYAEQIQYEDITTESDNSKGQIDACNSLIKKSNEQIERLNYINRQFCKITNQQENEPGTVEYCLSMFLDVQVMFSNKLDALLLMHGIDLIKLQEKCGIYLKSHRLITDVDFYIGSLELAQKYINELTPKESVPFYNIPVVQPQLTPTQIKQLEVNYKFWKSQENCKHKLNVNIFQNKDFDSFITMVADNDFTSIFKHGIKDRVKYNVYILARLLGDVWGQRTAKKLNCNYRDLTKNASFVEYEELKDMYSQPLP